ncbi:MAG TPA: class I SAM-dependent methyltransferase [Stellaceae bacterium]|jgi:ubiquinone/menaquinone biosynthesis C-methylase UbiE|nr:class I SAM-dependent methyltransferase [Stellaceae bacterium]
MARRQKKKPVAKKKKSASPARFYRSIGDKGWNNSDYFTYSSSSPAFREWLLAELGEKSRNILSIGCGNGELESYLIGEGYRVTGLDPAQPMLKRAARLGMKRGIGGDARALPFAEASFDIVIFPESIGHVPLPDVFAESRRVLKKRGALIVTTYASHVGVHPQYRKYRLSEMAATAEAVGLTVSAQRYLAAKRNSIADAPSDAKATLLYFRATVPATKAAPARTLKSKAAPAKARLARSRKSS